MKKTLIIPYSPHPKQRLFHNSAARFRIIAAGRRFGKSEAAVNEAIKSSMNQGSICWIVAPTFQQSMINLRKLKRFLPPEIIKNINKTEKYIELINGSTLWIKSADNPDNLRGEGINFLIVDEAAMVKKDAWEEALRPALSDTQGKAVFISTPKGMNYFHGLWTRGQDPEFTDYESWQFVTADNPYISSGEMEEAKRTLPDMVFRQEFMSEFLDDVGAVFRGVDSCIGGQFEDYDPNKSYFMGVDLAKYVDFTVLVVMDDNGHVCAFDRFNQIDWAFQLKRIKPLVDKYHPRIIVDSTGVGDPIYETMKREGMNVEGYKFTSESKKQLIEGLSLAIEQHNITYPDIPELINELKIFGFEISKTGNISYNAPAPLHDDCVIGLALATFGYIGGASESIESISDAFEGYFS
ncbi:MAG: terminase large subunit domain-containing protein [Methanosarcinaceae archaeon]